MRWWPARRVAQATGHVALAQGRQSGFPPRKVGVAPVPVRGVALMCRAAPARNDQSMATALLDRPVQDPATAPLAAGLAGPTEQSSAAAVAPATVAQAARKRWLQAGAVTLLAAAATAAGVELSQANLAGV